MRHGIILAKSFPAKQHGIKTREMIGEAMKKYPELTLVPSHYGLYEKNSKAFMEPLRRFSPVVEQYSIDEAYCDMFGTISLYGSPVGSQLFKRCYPHRIRLRATEENREKLNAAIEVIEKAKKQNRIPSAKEAREWE